MGNKFTYFAVNITIIMAAIQTSQAGTLCDYFGLFCDHILAKPACKLEDAAKTINGVFVAKGDAELSTGDTVKLLSASSRISGNKDAIAKALPSDDKAGKCDGIDVYDRCDGKSLRTASIIAPLTSDDQRAYKDFANCVQDETARLAANAMNEGEVPGTAVRSGTTGGGSSPVPANAGM